LINCSTGLKEEGKLNKTWLTSVDLQEGLDYLYQRAGS